MRLEWRSDRAADDHPLSFSSPELESIPGAAALFNFTDYPTVDVNDPQATLTVRTSPDAEPTRSPGRPGVSPTRPTSPLDGGFKAFHWYELVYRTEFAPVAGSGLLAIRDIVSHLRADPIDHTFAYGVSQAGRFLRQFVSEGLNVDEAGMQVFDGVYSDVASAARGEFNNRYAQPSVTQTTGFGTRGRSQRGSARPPARARRRAEDRSSRTARPSTGTATAHWCTSTRTPARTCPRTPTSGPTCWPAPTTSAAAAQAVDAAANPVHRLDVTPVNRALLVALEEWVVEGVQPPRQPGAADQRRHRRLPQGRAVRVRPHLRAGSLLAFLRAPVYLGPDADRGIGGWPAKLGETFVDLVSAVDADGNEVAGIRLPAVAAPLAAYTGWNPRRHSTSCPTRCTSASAASCPSRRAGRRSPSATRRATTTPPPFARPPKRLSLSGSCSPTSRLRVKKAAADY